MPKEKLRHATILEALHEYRKTVDSSTMYNEKDVQETIYQIEDLANSKAIIRNKDSKPDTIKGNIIIESYDVYKMFKSLIKKSISTVKTSLLDSSNSRIPVQATVSLQSGETWNETRRIEEVILTIIDTLDFTLHNIPDTYLKTIKKKINKELKCRKECEE